MQLMKQCFYCFSLLRTHREVCKDEEIPQGELEMILNMQMSARWYLAYRRVSDGLWPTDECQMVSGLHTSVRRSLTYIRVSDGLWPTDEYQTVSGLQTSVRRSLAYR